MSRTVYYAAISLDGFIAAPNGGVAWLDPFNSPDLGYERFVEQVGAVVLGRTTYEQSLTFGPWPYGDRPGLVVTSRPIKGLPRNVYAVSAVELPSALAALRRNPKDVWIVGGGRTASACLDAGLLDELELYAVPVVLGAGIGLFGRARAPLTWRLCETRAFDNGVVKLRYRVGGDDP